MRGLYAAWNVTKLRPRHGVATDAKRMDSANRKFETWAAVADALQCSVETLRRIRKRDDLPKRFHRPLPWSMKTVAALAEWRSAHLREDRAAVYRANTGNIDEALWRARIAWTRERCRSIEAAIAKLRAQHRPRPQVDGIVAGVGVLLLGALARIEADILGQLDDAPSRDQAHRTVTAAIDGRRRELCDAIDAGLEVVPATLDELRTAVDPPADPPPLPEPPASSPTAAVGSPEAGGTANADLGPDADLGAAYKAAQTRLHELRVEREQLTRAVAGGDYVSSSAVEKAINATILAFTGSLDELEDPLADRLASASKAEARDASRRLFAGARRRVVDTVEHELARLRTTPGGEPKRAPGRPAVGASA